MITVMTTTIIIPIILIIMISTNIKINEIYFFLIFRLHSPCIFCHCLLYFENRYILLEGDYFQENHYRIVIIPACFHMVLRLLYFGHFSSFKDTFILSLRAGESQVFFYFTQEKKYSACFMIRIL